MKWGLSMGQNFWREFWFSFRRAYGWLITVIGLPVAFVFWTVRPDSKVDFPLVLAIGFCALGIICSLGHLAYTSLQKLIRPLPRVLQGRAGGGNPPRTICLLEPSPLFSHGSAVSFYCRNEDGFEILVGLGRVLNVQDDSKIQVEILKSLPGQEDVAKMIEQNEKNTLARLRVKPTVPDFGPHLNYGGQDVGE
jgi:hypothetical protein